MSDKVKISERAFLARMRRSLEKEGLLLKQVREGTRYYNEMGPFYTVDISTNVAESRGVSFYVLIEWAREDGVLKPYEAVEGYEEPAA